MEGLLQLWWARLGAPSGPAELARAVTVTEVIPVPSGPRTACSGRVQRDDSAEALPQVTLEEVAHHCTENDCWIVLYDKVYDITDFLAVHPGGMDILCENAGRDATIPFNDVGHSDAALRMMTHLLVGEVVEEQRIEPAPSSNISTPS